MKIKWKPGFQAKCTAPAAYRFFERIREENDGRLDLDDAVHKSKPKGAPLHNELEWNNARCGDLYRRDQMRRVVRNIEVIRPDMVAPTRVYESIRVERVTEPGEPESNRPQPKHVFRSTEDILADPVMRAELLGQAVRDALAFRRRYAALSELSNLIHVIDEEVKRLA